VAVEAVKVASDKQLAVMIVKGIDRFPDNGDRVAGNVDIWWIVRILTDGSDICFILCCAICSPVEQVCNYLLFVCACCCNENIILSSSSSPTCAA